MKSIASKKIRVVYIAITISLLIIGLIFVFFFYSKNQNGKNIEKSGTDKSDEIKKKTEKAMNGKDGYAPSSGLPSNSSSKTTDQVPVNTSLSVTILSTTQSEGKVSAEAKVSRDGTCVFQYTTNGDKPVISQVPSSEGLCKSSIPEVEFAKLGEWILKVTFYNNGEKIEAVKNVTIY